MARKIGIERVKSRIRFLVTDFIQHRMNDPRQGFVTVHQIELTDDYKRCTLHVSILGEPGEQRRVFRMLQGASSAVRRQVGKGLSTRVTPEIHWIHDTSLEKAERMNSLFRQIEEERREDEPEESEDGEVEEGEVQKLEDGPSKDTEVAESGASETGASEAETSEPGASKREQGAD